MTPCPICKTQNLASKGRCFNCSSELAPDQKCARCEGWRFVVRFRDDGWEETLPCPDCNSDGAARAQGEKGSK